MESHVIRKYRIDVFILISLIIHILFALVSGLVHVKKNLPGQTEPIKVNFLEEKKPVVKPEVKGQIIETPKPKKKEEPISKKILSQHDSRMHSNVGIKGSKYKDNKTVIPHSKPRPAAPPPPPQTKKAEEKKTTPEPTTTKKLKQVDKAREDYKKYAEIQREKEKKEDFSKSVMRKKYLDSDQKGKSISDKKTTDLNSLPLKTPLLEGTDLAKYARLDTGARKEEEATADSDTISLDTQEFKYVSYFAQIKRKIELVWSYPPEAGKQGLFGKLLLKFTILKDGTLANLTLIDSAGHQILDDEAMRAVRMAAPYPPFPKRIDKSKLNIIANFSYYSAFSLVD